MSPQERMQWASKIVKAARAECDPDELPVIVMAYCATTIADAINNLAEAIVARDEPTRPTK